MKKLLLFIPLLISCERNSDSSNSFTIAIGSYSCSFPKGFEHTKPEHGIFYDRNNPDGIRFFQLDRGEYPDDLPGVEVRKIREGEIEGITYKSSEYTLPERDPMIYHIADMDGVPVSMTGDWQSFKQFLEGCKPAAANIQ